MSNSIKICIIGNGGREHALAILCAKAKVTSECHVIPGRKSFEQSNQKISCHTGISNFNSDEFFDKLAEMSPDIVIIGPEAPLVDGVSDRLRSKGVNVIGPSSAASLLESSKLYTKNLMTEAGVPCERFVEIKSFDHGMDELSKWGDIENRGLVIKADGLASGKGVFVANDLEDAINKFKTAWELHSSGANGFARVFFEEKVSGVEVSSFFLCRTPSDNSRPVEISYIGSALDHKRLLDDDKGPNTGGMGALAHPSILPETRVNEIKTKVINPILEQMRETGVEYNGFLFAGLMLDGRKNHVIEFNVRMGDPETQTLLPIVKPDVFVKMLLDYFDSTKKLYDLNKYNMSKYCAHLVFSSPGYAMENFGQNVELGHEIEIDREFLLRNLDADFELFFPGAEVSNTGKLKSVGGRALGVSVIDDSFASCTQKLYKATEGVRFDGAHYRRDIGKRYKDFSNALLESSEIPVAIFASGRGSNAINLLNFLTGPNNPTLFKPVLVFSDNPDAKVITDTNKTFPRVEALSLKRADFDGRESFEKRVLFELRKRNVEWLFLAGYMRVLSPYFLRSFKSAFDDTYQIVNIHPSLLPDFPGLDAYERFYDSEKDIGGVTVHYVDEGVDSGPIVLQQEVVKNRGETLESYKERGLVVEHQIYPKAIISLWESIASHYVKEK